MNQKTILGLLGAVGVSLVAVFGCSELPTGPADSNRMPVKGITLVDWTSNGYETPESLTQINDISLLGANMVTFIVTVYQSDSRASEFRVDPDKTPTQTAIANAIVRAKSLSFPLEVSIKPHIDLDNGDWRGDISPRDPAHWFDQYKAFIVDWARFAEAMRVEQFVVGTELAGTLEHESRWCDVIRDVRSVYSGELIYAASWDEAPLVPFWPDLDVVGVNFYAPVSKRLQTNRLDLLAGWQPWLSRIRLLHKKAGREILLTEIGYRSVDGAGMHPYDFRRQASVDFQEQADLYWAALEATGDKPWIRGMYWWNWFANGSGTDLSTDYTPRRKPAERELDDAWER
ncbi:MAG: hypothetical protein JSW58_03260 [Candidatus Latescibacterota bacterium]|nr:MAG: hypothetical protein JSW58_03260 [Candidatus Latescibacterota bacterium]